MTTPYYSIIAAVAALGFITTGSALLAAETATPPKPPTSPPAAHSVAPSTNRQPAMVSTIGRITAQDTIKNTLSVETPAGSRLVKCVPTTRIRLGGKVVGAADFKVGDQLMIRAWPEKDGSLTAIYLSNQLMGIPPMSGGKNEGDGSDKKKQ